MVITENRAKREAQLQLESIIAMVRRLKHCQECDGSDCALPDADVLEGLGLVGDSANEEERRQYHDEDEARWAIDEDPLSIEVRSDWEIPGGRLSASEYRICLCTGGASSANRR